MSSVMRSGIRYQTWALAVCSGVMISGGVGAGCAAEPGDDDEEVTWSSTEQALSAVAGDALPGTDAAEFAAAKAAFATVEEIDDGLGPIFNERGCGVCHSLGAVGGAGTQYERRFGRFVNGRFDSLSGRGGSL